MVYFYLFIFQLTVLFLLSKVITQRVYLLLYSWTGNKLTTAYLFSILFLPGTFIHEMSHFLMALILFVPVGQLELIPEYREGRLKLGSVPTAKTDPIRRFFIGVAPFIFGVTTILATVSMTLVHLERLNPLWILLVGYIIFSISNTMYSSPKDLEGMIEFLGLLVFGIILIFIFNVKFPILNLNILTHNTAETVFKTANLFLAVPLLIDIGAAFLLKRK